MYLTTLLIGLSMFFWVPMFAQTKSPDNTVGADSTTKKNVPNTLLLSRLENTRIIFKDGNIRKNCKVKEINDYWIVYEKDGSLHDLMIEKIKRIEIGNGTMPAVFFDEKNKPEISYEY